VSTLPPVRCDDPGTWRHKDEKIDLPRLLQLIEENDGPEGVDLHGADMERIDARPEALQPYAKAYARKHGADAKPPWLPQGDIKVQLAQWETGDLLLASRRIGWPQPARLQNIHLAHAHLEDTTLWDAHLEEAFLWDAHLEKADLTGAHLANAHLEGAHLENAHLTGAHLENASLLAAHLESAAFEAATLEGAFWYGCFLDRTRIWRHSLGQAIGDELEAHEEKTPVAYRGASEAYLLLKNNFESIGRYGDAAWAYIKEQQMGKMASYREWRSAGWRIWKVRLSLWRWVANWTYELLTGYGERPQMPLVWALAVVAAFAAIFAGAGNVVSGDGGATHDFVTALTHSIATFATVGFNTLEPVGWGARLLTAIEAMFGIGLFALFVFTLGNRMRRS
jgi:uncharacterized protein YjbI with pentapeptide repeats